MKKNRFTIVLATALLSGSLAIPASAAGNSGLMGIVRKSVTTAVNTARRGVSLSDDMAGYIPTMMSGSAPKMMMPVDETETEAQTKATPATEAPKQTETEAAKQLPKPKAKAAAPQTKPAQTEPQTQAPVETEPVTEAPEQTEAPAAPQETAPEPETKQEIPAEPETQAKETETETETEVIPPVAETQPETLAPETEKPHTDADHVWTEWEITHKGNCDLNGAKTRHCEICGKVENAIIPAPGHTLVPTKTIPAGCETRGQAFSVCETCGQEFFRYTDQPTGHDYSNGWEIEIPGDCITIGRKVIKCKNCGRIEQAEDIPAIGAHSFTDSWTEIPATCEEMGEKSRSCTVCGAQEIVFTDALGHDFSGSVISDDYPTCDVSGNGHIDCSRCDAVEYVTIPATRHDLYVKSSTSGDCEHPGTVTYGCNFCEYEETKTVAASSEHAYGMSEWSVGSTGTSLCDSIKETRRCLNCDHVETTEIQSMTKGHNWSSDNFVDAYCLDCGLHAPCWTNEWAEGKYGENRFDENGNPLGNYVGDPDDYRLRWAWAVAYRTDSAVANAPEQGTGGTMSKAGYNYAYDTVIDANHTFTHTAPAAKAGYRFDKWINAVTGAEISSDPTITVGWQYVGTLLEATYVPVG